MDNYGGFGERKRALLTEFMSIDGAVVLGKTTSNLFRHRNVKAKRIDVKDFNHVLNIDEKNLIADVEGMTTYEDLVEETLRYGLMPTVVPQLKSITIGGAVSGGGIESSSFKYGLVHETVEEMEILLGDGRIVVCTRVNRHKDLFYGFPNSYGTLGYVLRLKVRLVKVPSYVRLTHTRYTDAESYFDAVDSACKKYRKSKKLAFIDGSIFSEKEMYLTIGEGIDTAPYVSDYTYMNIYYRSIRKNQKDHTDYLTIKDYIWRWDTDWFWCSKNFGVQNKAIRFLVGKRFLRSTTYWKIRAWAARTRILESINQLFGARKESVIQDVEIPVQNAAEFLKFFQEEIGITPVWMCPTQPFSNGATYDLYTMRPKTLYINFGFWDAVKTGREDGYLNKKIESIVERLHGKKSLYSTSYYSEKKFRELYNGDAYDKLKRRYDAHKRFKTLYDKCVLRK
jgi:FAD/FMN-containing dehydrogenase